MLGMRLRVHDVLPVSTKNSTNDGIISIFRRSSRAICRSPDSLQEMAGHRHPPVLRIAKYPGDWERGNLTKCESKFASPQSSPSKSCNDLSRTVPCPESPLISAAGQRRCENNKRKAHFDIRLVNGRTNRLVVEVLFVDAVNQELNRSP